MRPSLLLTLLLCDNRDILPGFVLFLLTAQTCFNISAVTATQTVESKSSSGCGSGELASWGRYKNLRIFD